MHDLIKTIEKLVSLYCVVEAETREKAVEKVIEI